MRKKFSELLALLLCVSMLAACGGSSTQSSNTAPSASESKLASSSAPASSAAKSGPKKKLVIWHGFSSASTKPAIEAMFEKYNKVQDEVVVEYSMLPRNDLLKQYTLGVVSGTLPDLGTADNPDYPSLSAMGVFKDITDWFNGYKDKSVFIKSIIASGYYKNKLYGVPFAPNALALWCNEAMLKEAGISAPPSNFEEFDAAAKKLTKPGVYGFVIGAIKDESGTFQHLPWLMSAGGSLFNLTSNESKKAMNMLDTLFKQGYISKESLNWNQSDALNQFMAGNAAMVLSGNWNVATIRDKAPNLKYTVSKIPADKGGSVSCLGGELIGVSSACKNPDAALKFIEWFVSKDVNRELVKQCTRFSPRSDISGNDIYPGDAVMSFYEKILPEAYARGPHPKWTEMSNVFQTAYQEAWTGTKTVDAAMENAAKKIKEIDASVK